jgi:hypothetical protein
MPARPQKRNNLNIQQAASAYDEMPAASSSPQRKKQHRPLAVGGYDSVIHNNNNNDNNNDDDDDDSPEEDVLSGGYSDNLLSDNDEDDDDDLDSEARAYYTSGASELVTTVRGDGYGSGPTNKITTTKTTGSKSLQSHNYEPDESEVWRAYVAQQHFSNRGQWWTTGKLRAMKRWMLTLVVGVIQTMIAVMCNFGTISLSRFKYDHMYYLLEKNRLATIVRGWRTFQCFKH